MCSVSDRFFIGATEMALASYAYSAKMYLLPAKEVTGNLPARSEEISPVCGASVCASTDMAYTFSVLNGIGTMGGSSGFGLVVRQFLRWSVRCPLAVAVDGGKCLLMASVVSPGHVPKWLFATAVFRVVTIGLPNV